MSILDIVLRALSDLGLILLFGTAVFELLIGEPALAAAPVLAGQPRQRLMRLMVAGVVIALVSGAASLPLEAAAMSGEKLPAALPLIGTVLRSTHLGHVLALRGGLLLVAAILLIVWRKRRPFRLLACGLAGLALASGAMLGHAAALGGERG